MEAITDLILALFFFLDPPPEKLKRLVLTHGGRYIYYPCKSNITHIIASNSSYTKIRELKNGRAVLPNWITDRCVITFKYSYFC